MKAKAIQGSAKPFRRQLSASRFPPPVPPDRQPPSKPARDRQIVRKHKKAERQHPESQDRQEA
jgi:hypothetical protein